MSEASSAQMSTIGKNRKGELESRLLLERGTLERDSNTPLELAWCDVLSKHAPQTGVCGM